MDICNYKSGFVAILGKPNVGKSTLMNQLIGEPLAITHTKAQTTRHQLHGVVSKDNFQIIYTDTPGIITPAYPLQQAMMEAVETTYRDTDIIVWLVDARDLEISSLLQEKILKKTSLLVLNKIDLLTPTALNEAITNWTNCYPNMTIIPISAINNTHIDQLIHKIIEKLPVHPPYYPQETLTDKPERFFAQEIIRAKILDQYHQEIPYSVEVVINSFKETETLLSINAILHVERATQKAILLGHQGQAIKQLGIAARTSLEYFFQKKIFLAQHIKVTPNWRKNKMLLKKFGYPNVHTTIAQATFPSF